MGVASAAALLYTRGAVRALIVLYSINVFITFSLSMFGMLKHERRIPRGEPRRHVPLFAVGFVLCVTILAITVYEKFYEGGWMTLAVTGALVFGCYRIRKHYQKVNAKLKDLFRQLEDLPKYANETPGPLVPDAPTAGLLVSGYGGLGIHTLINVLRTFPGHFKNVVFFAVGSMDTSELRREPSVEALRQRTAEMLDQYVKLANSMGLPAVARLGVGTDVVDELEKLCVASAKEFPRITFFAGKVIFQREHWYQVLLHNEVGYALQKRLHWEGLSMMVLPARVR
jgi:hypothetical protein